MTEFFSKFGEFIDRVGDFFASVAAVAEATANIGKTAIDTLKQLWGAVETILSRSPALTALAATAAAGVVVVVAIAVWEAIA